MKKSSVFLHCYDSFLFDPIRDIGKIVDEAHKSDIVEIRIHPEAPDISDFPAKGTKLITFLDNLCTENSWPKSKFKIITGNVLKDESWPNLTTQGAWQAFLSGIDKNSIAGNKIVKKIFGCYVAGSSWPRIWLSAYLNQNHSQVTDQTFLRDPTNPGHAINLGLDDLLFNFSHSGQLNQSNMDMISKFIEKIPLLKQNDIDIEQHPSSVDTKKLAVSGDILSWYRHIFLDVVCETFFTGNSFRPTEKTARALATKTPFIVMASPHFLSNLRKIGFKTFNKYWNEEYDWLEGVQRILAVKNLIEEISQKSLQELDLILKDMENILDHNQRIYFDLTEQKLDTTFSII